eukprot:4650887-Pyramimonas_sp.AAC.1
MSWAQCAPAPEGSGWAGKVMKEGVQSADACFFSERVRVWMRWREGYSRGSLWGSSRGSHL